MEKKYFSGKKLKLARIQADMSIKELVEKLGSNNSVIWKYEKNEMLPRPDRVQLMADILGVTPDDFYEHSEDYTDEYKMAIDSLPVKLSQEEKNFIYFFMTREHIEKERLFGILHGLLLSDITDEMKKKKA